MNIDDLLKLAQLLQPNQVQGESKGLNTLVGKKVIIRTYSAGVHYGELIEKEGEDVILKNSRRLYYWKTKNNGISLSEVANAGLDRESKVCASVPLLWLKAIEIIICSDKAIKSIEVQNDYKA